MLVTPIAIATLAAVLFVLFIILIYKKRDYKLGEVMLPLSKKNVKQAITDFESMNGNKQLKEFTLKEITIMFHNDINKRCEKIEDTMESHLIEAKKQYENGLKFMGEHDKVISQVTSQLENISKELPEKGWCGKIDKMYSDSYPEGGDSIHDKVEILWYDRKLLKWVLGASLASLITGAITLLVGFMKGVF